MNARSYSLALCAIALMGFPTTASAKKPGPPVTAPFCGNGTIEADRGEVCDGNENLGGADCMTVAGGFTAGELTCNSNCQYDTTACTTCNNGTLETGEVCESDNLQGHTCESETDGARSFGTLACNETCDGFADTACRRFQLDDEAFPKTVADSQTGLMWQRTSDDGITDKDNVYTWGSDTFSPDGTAFTEFLATLNGLPLHTYQDCETSSPNGTPSCFRNVRFEYCYAGYCDWRLPEVNELATIAGGSQPPASDETLFGPRPGGSFSSSAYWTATRTGISASCPNFFDMGVWAIFPSGITGCETALASGRAARAVRYLGGQHPDPSVHGD